MSGAGRPPHSERHGDDRAAAGLHPDNHARDHRHMVETGVEADLRQEAPHPRRAASSARSSIPDSPRGEAPHHAATLRHCELRDLGLELGREDADHEVAAVHEGAHGGEVTGVESEGRASRGARDQRRRPSPVHVGDGHGEVILGQQVGNEGPGHHARAQHKHLLHRKLLRWTGPGRAGRQRAISVSRGRRTRQGARQPTDFRLASYHTPRETPPHRERCVGRHRPVYTSRLAHGSDERRADAIPAEGEPGEAVRVRQCAAGGRPDGRRRAVRGRRRGAPVRPTREAARARADRRDVRGPWPPPAEAGRVAPGGRVRVRPEGRSRRRRGRA